MASFKMLHHNSALYFSLFPQTFKTKKKISVCEKVHIEYKIKSLSSKSIKISNIKI